ncbi:MAG: glycoside hydrolase family 19 protein [Byssovorax sp.]
MARKIVYGCFPLLLAGLSALSSGCVVTSADTEDETFEESDRTENAAVVSTITEGDYVIRSAMTGKCVDISSSSTADGGKVQEWDCNGTNAQKFHISPTSDGYFKIINVNSNKGLDITGVSTAPNAQLQQWSYSGGANQQFKLVGRGNSQLSMHPRHTDMAIDLYWGSSANGTIMVQYPYTGGGNQLWTFDKVGATTGGGGGSGSRFGAILSRSVFETMFPNRSGFYTYDALVAAAATFPGLATTGDADTRKREVAAFLANVSHETGGLVYVEEIAKGLYCDTSWGPPGCGCAAGKRYFGRGPIQLSWNGNYCAAGNALGLPLQSNPDLLSQDATAAWRTGFWFWTTQTGAGSMTAHNAIINGAGFGQTIRTINGALECDGKNPGQVQSRVDAYLKLTGLLGVSPGSNTGC